MCTFKLRLLFFFLTAYTTYHQNDLFRLLANDDEDAFNELYHRYWQKLFAIAYNRLQQRCLAEDVVHDVFAALWANRQKLQVEQLENYLATATRYTVFAKLRREAYQHKYLKTLAPESLHNFTAEDNLHFKNILALIQKETEKLPDRCRLIFKYSREEGLPVKEIARLMHIKPKTVENQLGKALKHLRLAAQNFLGTAIIFLAQIF